MRSPLYNLSVFKLGYASAQVLPRPVTYRIADAFAWWSLRQSAELRSVMAKNLGIATGKTGESLARLVKENVRSFCRMLADYFLCAGDRAARAKELVSKWEGLQNLEKARAKGKGTILVTGHMGHWELGGLLLALSGVPLTVVTLPEPSQELMRWREAARHRLGIRTIAVGPGHDFAFVEMLRVLRGNGVLAMLVDRPYSGTGMPVTQFGHPTQFSTAAVTLAQHTGASIVPAFVLRQPNGKYRAEALPEVELASGDPREMLPQNVQRLANLFESIIRQYPEQWFNYVPVFPAP